MLNHNSYYHERLLSHIPTRAARALDIGCGKGDFACKLANRGLLVKGIDSDLHAILSAQKRGDENGNPQFVRSSFWDEMQDPERYDVVSVIAALHHIQEEVFLNSIRTKLEPGGVLIILGLFRESSLKDFLISLAAVPINWLFRIRIFRNQNESDYSMIVKPPKRSIKELKTRFREYFPGCRFRRHLFWRYSLVWQNPQE